MDFWNNLWLKEAFATYLSYYLMEIVDKDPSVWEHFSSNVILEAMEFDQIKSTHPLSVSETNFTKNILMMFDKISYQKVRKLLI